MIFLNSLCPKQNIILKRKFLLCKMKKIERKYEKDIICSFGALICFCFISNFLFSQNLFLIFFNDRIEIFESDGSIRKRIKIPIFSKKKSF